MSRYELWKRVDANPDLLVLEDRIAELEKALARETQRADRAEAQLRGMRSA